MQTILEVKTLNLRSVWVISSKFAAFLQNIFSEQHLWRAASGHLHYNKKHTVSYFLSFFIYSSSVPLIYVDSHPYSLHSHPQFPTLPPWFSAFPHSHPDSTHSRRSLHSIPWFPIPAFTDSRLFIMTARIFIIVWASHVAINNFQENRSLVKIVLNYLLKLYC